MIVTNTKGTKRDLNAELNLVPFIDLLSMCICFLLMTAVWIQVSSLTVKQTHGTKVGASTGPYDLMLSFITPRKIDCRLEKHGKPFKRGFLEVKNDVSLKDHLSETLRSWLQNDTTKVQSAILKSSPLVSYGDMVIIMDALRELKIVNLGVMPSGGS